MNTPCNYQEASNAAFLLLVSSNGCARNMFSKSLVLRAMGLVFGANLLQGVRSNGGSEYFYSGVSSAGVRRAFGRTSGRTSGRRPCRQRGKKNAGGPGGGSPPAKPVKGCFGGGQRPPAQTDFVSKIQHKN